MKISPTVRPGRRIEKKGKDRTGQNRTVSFKTQVLSFKSPIWGEAPTQPFVTKNYTVVQTFELKFSGVTILQGVEFSLFLLILSWALQQCSATALPVIMTNIKSTTEFQYGGRLFLVTGSSNISGVD